MPSLQTGVVHCTEPESVSAASGSGLECCLQHTLGPDSVPILAFLIIAHQSAVHVNPLRASPRSFLLPYPLTSPVSSTPSSHVHPSTELAEWPAGSVLPSHVVPSIPSWAWNALATARGELKLAMESVIEDLEGLSSSMSARGGGGGDGTAVGGDAQDEAEESLRVDDLEPPPPQRAAYEVEEFEPDARCEDFELIDASSMESDSQSGWVMVAHASATWTG